MFNHDFDPYAELLRLQSDILELNQDYIKLQCQLHENLMIQQGMIKAINNQAEALLTLQKTVAVLAERV